MARVPGDPRSLRVDASAPLTVVRAGRVPYLTAWNWQRRLAADRAEGRVGDVVLLLEHPPVYTLGRRADQDNLLFDAAERARRGIEVHRIDRGGDVTYHGPGQLVGYPILRLDGPRVVDHVRALEEVNLRVAASYGIVGTRVAGFSGVWVDDAKLTAVGVHVTAGRVTTHGWATNVATDLSDFDGIVPCGIRDKAVTSLATLGVPTDLDAVVVRTEAALADVFGTEVVPVEPRRLGLVADVA
jgi:lipoyl(octanoyl) transferase